MWWCTNRLLEGKQVNKTYKKTDKGANIKRQPSLGIINDLDVILTRIHGAHGNGRQPGEHSSTSTFHIWSENQTYPKKNGFLPKPRRGTAVRWRERHFKAKCCSLSSKFWSVRPFFAAVSVKSHESREKLSTKVSDDRWPCADQAIKKCFESNIQLVAIYALFLRLFFETASIIEEYDMIRSVFLLFVVV